MQLASSVASFQVFHSKNLNQKKTQEKTPTLKTKGSGTLKLEVNSVSN